MDEGFRSGTDCCDRPNNTLSRQRGLGLVALQFCCEGLGFLRRDTVPLLVDLDEVGGIFISHLRSRVGDGIIFSRQQLMRDVDFFSMIQRFGVVL